MRRVLQDVSAATAVLGFAWMIAMWGSVLGAAWGWRAGLAACAGVLSGRVYWDRARKPDFAWRVPGV